MVNYGRKLTCMLDKIENFIYDINRFVYDRNTGTFPKDPNNPRRRRLTGKSVQECNEAAITRKNNIKNAIDNLTHTVTAKKFITPKGRVLYYLYPDKVTANTYIIYTLDENKQDLEVIAVYLVGIESIDNILSTFESYVLSISDSIRCCYERHLRIPLRVRESLRCRGYRIIKGRILDRYNQIISE